MFWGIISLLFRERAMIGGVRGILLAKMPPQVTVDVSGVMYELDVPMSTFCELPPLGQEVFLKTHLAIREDAHCLYGFLTEAERKAFRQVLKISGIGAKTALGILSGLSVKDLMSVIARQDVQALVNVPGIGKKTAERLLLELKESSLASVAASGTESPSSEPLPPSGLDDVVAALISLGYAQKDALLGTKDFPVDVDVSEGIRKALKTLSKR